MTGDIDAQIFYANRKRIEASSLSHTPGVLSYSTLVMFICLIFAFYLCQFLRSFGCRRRVNEAVMFIGNIIRMKVIKLTK